MNNDASVKASTQEPAGLLYRTRSRATGVVGSVYNPQEQGIDVGDAKYAVVCEAHSNILAVDTLRTAKRDAANTSEWCDECRAMAPCK